MSRSNTKTTSPNRPALKGGRAQGIAAFWALAAGGVVLGAATAIFALGDDDPQVPKPIAPVEQPAAASISAWTPTDNGLAVATVNDALRPQQSIDGLRLRLDETVSHSPVSKGVNEADARLKSLILRHDRLAEMVADLRDGGIEVALQINDLVPTALPGRSLNKPRLLRAEETNLRHPLYRFVADMQVELATALEEPQDSALARIDISNARLDALAIRQFGVLDRIEREVEGRRERLASVPRALGIQLPSRSEAGGLGGPLVPLSGTQATIYAFDTRMEAVELTFANLSDIGRIVTRLPVRRPVDEHARVSSRYGPRVDPFLGRPAMHGGLDFAARSGTPVKSAGAGKIVRAGRLGGYGKVVEINHGQGLTSRYAHLSRITVKVGDSVTPGQLIGKVGSTGRSTGPHLHFEVRRNGATRNPYTYLRAGKRL